MSFAITSRILLASLFLYAVPGPSRAQPAATFTLDVPAQSLASALTRLGEISNQQILFAPDAVRNKTSPPLHGRMTLPEALRNALSGSDLEFRIISQHTIAVVERGRQADAPARDADRRDTARASPPGSEEVTVTGTSIHGFEGAPIGSNLLVIGSKDIARTSATDIQMLLNTVPGLSTAGAAPQGPNNSYFYTPTIHQLAGSASNTTLVLIDGHRLPVGNIQHSEVDPNIIPILALQRVEILADGASSVYGSDAVAGVINFITRPRYDGFELLAQGGTGASYSTFNAGLLTGTSWSDGSAMLAYSHVFYSRLANGSRDFLQANHMAAGGTNFQSFNCSPASIQPAGSDSIYTSAFSGIAIANTTANAPCDISQYGDALPKETRDSAMLKLSQSLGDRISASLDLIYGVRQDNSVNQPGTVSATVFGAGPQANPFFVQPAGYSGNATAQTVRFNIAGLLPLALTRDSSHTFYVNSSIDFAITEDWTAAFSNTAGLDVTKRRIQNGICGFCADLALNGTTGASGDTAAVPLTAATALDVWNPLATNRTSPSVLAALKTAQSLTTNRNSFDQLQINLDGPPFQLSAGAARLAIGGEIVNDRLVQDVSSVNATSSAATGSVFADYRFGRVIHSAYIELALPVISPDMNIGLVHKLDLDVSGRLDGYSDVGSTANPKFAANWYLSGDIRLFGNYSTSFVAPPLDSNGDPQKNFNYATSGVSTYSAGTIQLPTSVYPGIAGVLPGCPIGAPTCSVGQSTVQGITIASGGGGKLKPQTGISWSLGTSVSPSVIPGLSLAATWFNNSFKGGVTSPTAAAEVTAPSLRSLFTVCPTGCSASAIATAIAGIPIKGSLPATAYFLYNFSQRNALDLQISGIDLLARYDFATRYGTFRISDALTEFVRFDEDFAGGSTFSVLGTSGINQTFPSIQTAMRLGLGWSRNRFDADLFVNYTGSYRNLSGNVAHPIVFDGNGYPAGGGDVVSSNTTLDLHLSYRFAVNDRDQEELYIECTNLLDRPPPFFNSVSGYNSFVSNPIGRVTSLGMRVSL